MNYILLKLNSAPCTISADDRLAYFGALDAFHQEGGLAPPPLHRLLPHSDLEDLGALAASWSVAITTAFFGESCDC